MSEQRMREQFEKWAEGIDMAPDFAAEREKCPDDPTYGWNYGKLTAWEAWQARDAEVQALRDEAQNLRVSLRDGSAWAKWTTARDAEVQALRDALSGTAGALQSAINASGDLSEDDRVRFAGETEYVTLGSVLDEANAALAGGETGETE